MEKGEKRKKTLTLNWLAANNYIMIFWSDHEAAGTDSDDQKEIMAPYGEVDNELERPESCEQDSYGVGGIVMVWVL